MTIGIYKITNKINNKSYIGKSAKIEERWKYHRLRMNDERGKNKPLYRAFRQYGIDNFSFEILESFEEDDLETLNEKEKYYIQFYNTYGASGYNATIGGDGGKTHEQGTFSNEEIIQIRKHYLECKYTYSEIYNKYYKDKISLRGFQAIWCGQNYKNIMPEIYTEENKKKHIILSRKKEGVKRRKIDLPTIKTIRKRVSQGETMKSIWQKEYKDIYSYGGFRDVINKKHPDEMEDWCD